MLEEFFKRLKTKCISVRSGSNWWIGFVILSVFPLSVHAEDKWRELVREIQVASTKNDWDTAIELLKRAQSIACGATRIADENLCVDTLSTIGWIYSSRGMMPEAVPYYEEAYRSRISKFGQYHVKTLGLCANYGGALIESGRAGEAEKVLLPCVEEKNDVDVLTQNSAYLQLALALASQHKFEDGETLIRKLMVRLERRSLQETPEYADALYAISINIQKQNGGRFREAIKILEETLSLSEKVHGTESERYARFEGDLAELLLIIGRVDESEKHARHGLEVFQKKFGKDHPRTAAAEYVLGKVLLYKGDYEAAENSFEDVYKIYVNIFGSQNQYLKDVQWYLIQALEKQGKEKEARKFEQKNRMWVFR